LYRIVLIHPPKLSSLSLLIKVDYSNPQHFWSTFLIMTKIIQTCHCALCLNRSNAIWTGK